MIRVVILGPPRTKKTSNRLVYAGKGDERRPFVLPSRPWENWVKSATLRRPPGLTWPLPGRPYNCAAIFYRDRDSGDLLGYLQGLGDFLQSRGLIRNDKWLLGFDGSRLDLDRENPRVELVLTPIELAGRAA